MGEMVVEVRNLLIVDDNPADVRFIEEALHESALHPTVHSVHTGSEALDFLAQDSPFEDAPAPDFVMLDWHLAETTGEDVLTTVKQDHKNILVIVMTGSQTEDGILDTPLPDADAVIEKPTDPEEYVEAIRSVVTSQ